MTQILGQPCERYAGGAHRAAPPPWRARLAPPRCGQRYGIALSIKTSVFQSSSLKTAPITPNPSHLRRGELGDERGRAPRGRPEVDHPDRRPQPADLQPKHIPKVLSESVLNAVLKAQLADQPVTKRYQNFYQNRY